MMQALMERPRIRQLVIILVTLLMAGSLLVLANTLREVDFRAGISQETTHPEALLPGNFVSMTNIFPFLRTLFGVLALLAAVYLLADKAGRRQLPAALLKGVYIILFLVALFAFGRLFVAPTEVEEEVTPVAGERAEIAEVEIPELENQEGELIQNIDPSSELVDMLTIVLIVGTAALGYLWWLRRETTNLPPTTDLLEKQFRLALETLRQNEQPLEEIIRRCYREMTQAVYQQYGVNRRQGMTPREYELTLQKMSLPLGAVRRLTRLFEKVRYGNYEASQRDRMEAIDSLETIVKTFETQNQEAIEIARKAAPRHDRLPRPNNRGWR